MKILEKSLQISKSAHGYITAICKCPKRDVNGRRDPYAKQKHTDRAVSLEKI